MGLAWLDYVSLLVAALLGGIIGIERERDQKAAGLRTNVLICMGAAMFTILSKNSSDESRIAAQLVSGIGFLGAGAIIRDKANIRGLTTAASIWVVASIGMACGLGYFLMAVLGTFLTIATLVILHPLGVKISGRNKNYQTEQPENQQDL